MDAPANRARFHTRLKLGFYLIPEGVGDSFDYDVEMTLPKGYNEIRKEYKTRFNSFYSGKMDDYFSSNSKNIFPEGELSLVPLHDFTTSFLLQTTYKDDDSKKWLISSLDYKITKIKDNGSIQIARPASKILFVDITKPDTISLKSVLENPRVAMDIFLEGLNITRDFNPSKIRILSLGSPQKVSSYVDNYGRNWTISLWITDYSDEAVITFSTPTPQGVAMIMMGCSTADIDTWMYDLKRMTDFIYLSYYGKLREWREFVSQTKLLPGFMKDLKFAFKPKNSMTLNSRRFSIRVDRSVLDLDDDTRLGVNYGYTKENNRTVWDIRRVFISEDSKSNYFILNRHLKPDKKASGGLSEGMGQDRETFTSL